MNSDICLINSKFCLLPETRESKKKKKKGKTQRRIQRKTLNPNGHIEFVSKNAKKDCVFTIDKRKSKISLANAYVTVPYDLRPFRAYLAINEFAA